MSVFLWLFAAQAKAGITTIVHWIQRLSLETKKAPSGYLGT